MPFTYTPGNAALSGTFPALLGDPQGITWDGQQLVIVDDNADGLWTLARNADGSYTPANAVLQGNWPAALGAPRGITWDGLQLVILDQANRKLFTLARNADGSYTPANAVDQVSLNPGPFSPLGITWDGLQLVISDSNNDRLWTLARNADGSYTAANAVDQGSLPSGVGTGFGITWDSGQLVILEIVVGIDTLWTLARNTDGSYTPANASNQGTLPSGVGAAHGASWDGFKLALVDDLRQLWTLEADNAAPVISAVTATPSVIDHGATSAIEVTAERHQPGRHDLDYQWTSDVGGTISAPTAANTNWTAPTRA